MVGRRFIWAFVGLTTLIVGCSSGPGRVANVDGVEISDAAFQELHVDTEALDEDERVGATLLLILHQAFLARAASELELSPSEAAIELALESQRAGLEGQQLTDVLATRNETEARLRVNAELDAVRDLVGAELVRTESGGFDLAEAEFAFRMVNSEVCIRQIQLEAAGDVAVALERIEGGERFEDVARALSIDPFVSREDGVGAGGDLGCSAPNALPEGLDRASLETDLDEVTGPVESSIGLHVVQVYRRSDPNLTSRRDEVIEAAVADQGPELFRRWAVAVLQDIDVEVDESIGRWGVLPETDPVPTVVPPYRFEDTIG